MRKRIVISAVSSNDMHYSRSQRKDPPDTFFSKTGIPKNVSFSGSTSKGL